MIHSAAAHQCGVSASQVSFTGGRLPGASAIIAVCKVGPGRKLESGSRGTHPLQVLGRGIQMP